MNNRFFALGELRDLDIPLFTLGTTPISLFSVTQLLILLLLVMVLSRWTGRLVSERLLGRTELDLGTRKAFGSIVRYLVVVVGAVAILQTYGINLSTFNFLAGAFGVGIGFGLQNIFQNFISGLIIMLERPVKVGDRIELGTVLGDVAEIGARRTTVITNDRTVVIVPNSRFIVENVTNYAYLNAPIRLRLSVNIAAGHDPDEVQRLLCGVAKANNEVLHDPEPVVRLLALQAGGAMRFELQVWNITRVRENDVLTSDLYFAMHRALREQGIALA